MFAFFAVNIEFKNTGASAKMVHKPSSMQIFDLIFRVAIKTPISILKILAIKKNES